MIYYDIDEESLLAKVLHEGDTAWMTIGGAIMESDQVCPAQLESIICVHFADIYLVLLFPRAFRIQPSSKVFGCKTRTARRGRLSLTTPTQGRLSLSEPCADARIALSRTQRRQ